MRASVNEYSSLQSSEVKHKANHIYISRLPVLDRNDFCGDGYEAWSFSVGYDEFPS